MLHVLMILADIIIKAGREPQGDWIVEIQDNLTGQATTKRMNDAHFAEMCRLAIDGDSVQGENVFTNVVREMFKDEPNNLRPFP